MKKLIITLTILFFGISSVYSQKYNNIFRENTSSNIYSKSKGKNNLYSLNTSFAYIFVKNTNVEYTNSKGFSIDFQYKQNDVTSWLIGCNFNFYKEYNLWKTLNISITNILLGPKFNFSNNNLSAYYRINTGMSFFGQNAQMFGGIGNAILLYQALGVEYKISKQFKLYIEPNINMYFSYGSFINLGINTGISTALF